MGVPLTTTMVPYTIERVGVGEENSRIGMIERTQHGMDPELRDTNTHAVICVGVRIRASFKATERRRRDTVLLTYS